MISNAWFTINYFHVSFGKQDQLQRAIELLKGYESLNIDEDREKIFQRLTTTQKKESLTELKYFNTNVPHWFLSPWFPGKDRPEIYQNSIDFQGKCLYALKPHEIVVNPEWVNYLTENAKLLKDFCYWNLTVYLQARNPFIPDIPNKLIKPAERNSLTQQRSKFWDVVVSELGSVKCIYTGEKLTIGNYAVEHFIPYSFVSHDLIWNLIPADKSFNSSKSDKLPQLDKYFNSFFNLQKNAIEIIQLKTPKNKFLEDYLTIFPDFNITNEKFRERMQPLITIASNNGFEFMS